MKAFIKKWNQINLVYRILCGLVIGVILGVLVPSATGIQILGTMFVGALKAVAPILVFILVLSSLAQANGKSGKQFRTVITLYAISTLSAAFVAVIGSFLFPVTMTLSTVSSEIAAPGGITDVLVTILNNIVENPVKALVNGNYIGILTWSALFGVALRKSSAHTKEMLNNVSEAVSTVVRWIINLAPFGIAGIVYDTVSSNGLTIFKDYSKLILLLIGCMLFVAFVTNALIAGLLLKRSPYPLVFRCIRESGITAFFTRSSAANIPVNMELCDKLGLDKDVYSVTIPLGATINMNGAAITITVMTLAAVHTLGIAVDIPTALILSVLATVSACGASGVAGGSLLLIPLACSLFGISNDVAMQVVAVGFVLSVIQDSFETALNSSGDVLFAATAEFMQWIKEGREVKF